MQQQVPLLVKSKSCAAVVESKVLFEGELSISLLFQDNFHNAYVRIKDSGELLEYQNDSSKMPTNTYDLKTCWIDQSVDRHADKRTSSSVSSETHQVVLVRAKGGPPVSLRTAQVQVVSNLLLTLSVSSILPPPGDPQPIVRSIAQATLRPLRTHLAASPPPPPLLHA